MNRSSEHMKIDMYFDVWFVFRESEERRPCRDHGYYLGGVTSPDVCRRFVRKISLPAVPMKGQVFQLNIDPMTETSIEDDDNAYYVESSGFFEEGDRIVPYFVISDEELFSEWIESDHSRKLLSAPDQFAKWNQYVKGNIARLTKIFAKHGWAPVLNGG